MVTNTEVFQVPACTQLSQRRQRWAGHIHRMASGRIHNYVLYDELVTGIHTTGRPCLRYKGTCKRDMKMTGIDINNRETVASERDNWRSVVKVDMKRGDERRRTKQAEKRNDRKQRSANAVCMSATITDAVEIATSELDFLVTAGDAYHRTDHHCGTNLSDKIDECHIYSAYILDNINSCTNA